MLCQLCDRDFEELTVHHLIPRQQTKKKRLDSSRTIDICSACHRQVHTLFSNRQLAVELNTLETLKVHPDMAKFLNWARKQDPQKSIRVKALH